MEYFIENAIRNNTINQDNYIIDTNIFEIKSFEEIIDNENLRESIRYFLEENFEDEDIFIEQLCNIIFSENENLRDLIFDYKNEIKTREDFLNVLYKVNFYCQDYIEYNNLNIKLSKEIDIKEEHKDFIYKSYLSYFVQN